MQLFNFIKSPTHMSGIWDFRYRQTQAMKTRFVKRGANHLEVEVGKDFETRYDLKTERGKRAFYEELRKTGGEQFTPYDRNRQAMDTLRKGIDQHGISSPRIHRVHFGG